MIKRNIAGGLCPARPSPRRGIVWRSPLHPVPKERDTIRRTRLWNSAVRSGHIAPVTGGRWHVENGLLAATHRVVPKLSRNSPGRGLTCAVVSERLSCLKQQQSYRSDHSSPCNDARPHIHPNQRRLDRSLPKRVLMPDRRK